MKNFMTNVVALVVTVAVALGAIAWVTKNDHTTWPDFNTVAPVKTETPKAPQVVSSHERDFGWRIGDVIPVELYLRQQPGTIVDLHSLAVEGDFEIVENPAFVTRDFKDGSKNIGIKFKIQSMSNAKQLSLKVSMLYRELETGDDKLISIPTFAPFTSPTWDGRDVIQDGKPEYRHEGHLLWTMGYILAGIAGAIFAFILRRKFVQAIKEEKQRVWDTRRRIARREFDEAWARFENGDFSIENYKSVARCVRKLFRIESKVMREIERELGDGHPYRVQTLKILKITGKLLYGSQPLTRDEHYSLKTIFDEIVPPIEEPGVGDKSDEENASAAQ